MKIDIFRILCKAGPIGFSIDGEENKMWLINALSNFQYTVKIFDVEFSPGL